MAIPPEKIEEIRNLVDITDIVSEYVKLKKTGRNFFGLCPFHNEKTPSFSVNPEKQIFHCFGCGAGGNVFTFLMKTGNLSFIEAVETIAKRVGIDIEKYKKQEKRDYKLDNLYDANEFAARFYINNLKSNAGKKALDYLKERGFDDNTLKTFGIGFAFDEWDSLINAALKEGINKDSLEKCGLVIFNETKKSYYDRFRNRITFPIVSESGRVIAFGARMLENVKDQPKYINSPETAIYRKGKTLYGLYQNRKNIRKKNHALLVEGYTDVIALFQHGINTAAASLGTSLTEDQSRVLSRYTENIKVLYDSDEAGIKAAIRGADILLSSDLDVSVIPLEKGEDPDSYIRKHGCEKFIKLIETCTPFIDFYFNIKLEKSKNLSVREKITSAKDIIEVITGVNNDLKRDILIGELANKIGVSKEILYPELKKELNRRRGFRSTRKRNGPDIYNKELREVELISFASVNKDIFEYFLENMEEDIFKTVRIKEILNVLKAYYRNHDKLKESILYDYIDDKNKDLLIGLIDKIPKVPSGWSEEQFFKNCLKTVKEIFSILKIERINEQIGKLKTEMNKFDNSSKEASEISHEIYNLELLKKKLKRENI